MKKTIPNPEYDKAFAIGWLANGKIGSPVTETRFKSKPPGSWPSLEAMINWMDRNRVLPTIEVDE